MDLEINITAVMAGDAQMDPVMLHKLLDPIVEGKADYAKGNRLTHKEKIKMPRFRAFGNGMLTFLTKIGFIEVFAGSSLILVASLKNLFKVAIPFVKSATTISPLLAFSVCSQTTKSPSLICSSIIGQ